MLVAIEPLLQMDQAMVATSIVHHAPADPLASRVPHPQQVVYMLEVVRSFVDHVSVENSLRIVSESLRLDTA